MIIKWLIIHTRFKDEISSAELIRIMMNNFWVIFIALLCIYFSLKQLGKYFWSGKERKLEKRLNILIKDDEKTIKPQKEQLDKAEKIAQIIRAMMKEKGGKNE